MNCPCAKKSGGSRKNRSRKDRKDRNRSRKDRKDRNRSRKDRKDRKDRK